MPYTAHESAGTLPPSETEIWRFTSLGKFLHLVSSHTLHFSQLKQFRAEDPFEGSLGLPNKLFYEAITADDQLARELLNIAPDEPLPPNLRQVMSYDYMRELYDYFASEIYANCWHMSPVESAFLWSAYATRNEGIAIKTTIGRLVAALSVEKRDIYVGPVTYIDYKNNAIKEDNILNAAYRKRLSFQHENELRCAFTHSEAQGYRVASTGATVPDGSNNPSGIRVTVNLVPLISEVCSKV
jgi:hypothetical protein